MEKSHLEQVFEMLGVNPCEEFKLRFNTTHVSGIYRFDDNLRLERKLDSEGFWDDMPCLLYQILNGSYIIIKQPIRVSKEDKIVIDYLKLGGYKWIARDREYEVYAYRNKPIKNNTNCWNYGFGMAYHIDLKVKLFHIVKWEDEEPFSLEREFEVAE